jgi:hypothetical protein
LKYTVLESIFHLGTQTDFFWLDIFESRRAFDELVQEEVTAKFLLKVPERVFFHNVGESLLLMTRHVQRLQPVPQLVEDRSVDLVGQKQHFLTDLSDGCLRHEMLCLKFVQEVRQRLPGQEIKTIKQRTTSSVRPVQVWQRKRN